MRRDRLAGLSGPRVGLYRAGGQTRGAGKIAENRRRSIPLDMQGALGEASGVWLISPRKGPNGPTA